MGKIRGMTVILYSRTQVGTDPFGCSVYEESAEAVDNVLVGEPATDDIVNTLDLTGKRLAYTLGIPKGDTHEWEDKTVEFFGRRFRTFGAVVQSIEANVPLSWDKKVMVETYD